MSVDFPASLLVVTTCSATKRIRLPNAPGFKELADAVSRERLLRQHASVVLPAAEMYSGQHHLSAMRNVERLRTAFPGSRIDVAIVSAGFGVVDETTPIIPYNATFTELPTHAIREVATRLDIGGVLRRKVVSFEACVLLLSESYLFAVEAPLRTGRRDIYMAPNNMNIEGDGNLCVRAGVEQSRRFGVAPRMARAAIFERIVDETTRTGWRAATDAAVSGSLASRQAGAQLELALS